VLRRFHDRADAGMALSRALRKYRSPRDQTIVVALPRGGVPVAHEIARALGIPLDICIVRKLGVPGREELAMGAVASGGIIVLNPDVISFVGIHKSTIDRAVAEERAEIERREHLYREGRPSVDVRVATVLLVDDGLATGATMRAAVTAIRQRGAASVVVAVPVGPRETCVLLRKQADEVVCLHTPYTFEAVGEWYDAFPQVSDDEVRRLLREHQSPPAPAGR